MKSKKINKRAICFLCKEIKIDEASDWESWALHAKNEHKLDLNSINTSFNMPEHTQGWMLKLPNGKPWLYVSTSEDN